MATIHDRPGPAKTAPVGVAVLTRDEVRELVLDAVAEALADHEPAEPAPALVDRAGLARALNVSLSTVDRLRDEGAPTVRIGDSPRFVVADVVRWLQARSNGGPTHAIAGGKS